ncbi:MAG: phosphoglucosamine mutase [endosymbiont of Galathealinum brachiosum]|uniref:Phosphoglucosamine mutase n=1 Tax=endosymbiont of Galathealinum brachiosum TaxID=2200906 RepID=A0A370DA04_9GAMM|nr:MAG: phosphoglucosamine mutase [endosymbiont of Galathealinum brachiosum]
MAKKYFGTDGIRGRVGQGQMTPQAVMKLGWSVGKVLANHGNNLVVIGKDTRISGYMFEASLEAGLSAAGVDSKIIGPMPTPGIAYLTRTLRASAGIVISASHNPFYDNGLKFFSAEGTKLPDDIENEIEAMFEKEMEIVDSASLGKAERIEDAQGRYIESCKATIPIGTTFKGIKVVLDCANGATYHIAPNVFAELGAEVITIADKPDGVNINENCGSTHPNTLAAAVLQNRADIGIAFDGDGDRLMMVDSKGQIIDGDEILYIITKARLAAGEPQGGVAGTMMSNLGLELAIKKLGLEFVRTDVGDRYVMECLREKGWSLGGENSGHIICLDRTTTGDGIVSALQVMAYLADSNSTLVEALADMTMMPQILINVPLPVKTNPIGEPKVQQAVEEVEKQLNGRGRVLLRASGTEPLIRVMVEGEEGKQVTAYAQQIADAVSASVAHANPS